jgi:hypothetical protein
MTSSILKFPLLKEIVMDSCEVIYLSKLAQRGSDYGKLPVCSELPGESVAAQERRDKKVVDLHAWAAAHRSGNP